MLKSRALSAKLIATALLLLKSNEDLRLLISVPSDFLKDSNANVLLIGSPELYMFTVTFALYCLLNFVAGSM
nr:MAG TPA: hypothetical protein [Bacteriophage sp.]DAV23954.1 MAG TPA: hypothetical protein [Bacteriophage sp.]